VVAAELLPQQQTKKKKKSSATKRLFGEQARTKLSRPPPPAVFANPLFRDCETGEHVRYCDDMERDDPDEGTRARDLFFSVSALDSSNFDSWLRARKSKWRTRYDAKRVVVEDLVQEEAKLPARRRRRREETDGAERAACSRREITAVPVDFWSRQGYGSFDGWLRASTYKWKQGYSWNRRKRKRLEQDWSHQDSVHVDEDFREWMRVRKNQWRIARRKRQRQRLSLLEQLEEDGSAGKGAPSSDRSDAMLENSLVEQCASPTAVAKSCVARTSSVGQQDLILIDAMLEEQERERKALEERPPLDISWFFDSSLGCPDDAIVNILKFLDITTEYARLLALSHTTRKQLQSREAVWRQLCPSHWQLPRRPRKPWHSLFFEQLRRETEANRKRNDDTLGKASNLLLKGDHQQSIEKLINQNPAYDINYNSGVVCERNSILNLAVIHQRHKVVRWLVETKKADIETADRGNFTPLLNAAYAGDKWLVRFLMQHGADRFNTKGRYHYTKGVAPSDFEGMTAAEWAEERGHPDLAHLIRIGL